MDIRLHYLEWLDYNQFNDCTLAGLAISNGRDIDRAYVILLTSPSDVSQIKLGPDYMENALFFCCTKDLLIVKILCW